MLLLLLFFESISCNEYFDCRHIFHFRRLLNDANNCGSSIAKRSSINVWLFRWRRKNILKKSFTIDCCFKILFSSFVFLSDTSSCLDSRRCFALNKNKNNNINFSTSKSMFMITFHTSLEERDDWFFFFNNYKI